jgi:predicted lipoprotein with Yx(FWY)xxD motif
MMTKLSTVVLAAVAGALLASPAPAQDKARAARDAKALLGTERAKDVPMPPGFKIMATEVEGPVFATAEGMTLYKWQLKNLRNGSAGERKGEPACYDVKTTETAGLMSPYPPGLVLPELEARPACTDVWKPVYAAANSQPLDKWTILTRKDGTKQWAYDGFSLYTSVLDKAPGDVYGAPRKARGDSPSYREAVKPPPDVPPGFEVTTTTKGRLLVTDKQQSVYVLDGDSTQKTTCVAECTQTCPGFVSGPIADARSTSTCLTARTAARKAAMCPGGITSTPRWRRRRRASSRFKSPAPAKSWPMPKVGRSTSTPAPMIRRISSTAIIPPKRRSTALACAAPEIRTAASRLFPTSSRARTHRA